MAVQITESQPGTEYTAYPHIVRRQGVCGGRLTIEGTRIPVWQVANLWRMGETEDDFLDGHPNVSRAALHSALAYYFDHQEEIDGEIEENRPERVLAQLRADPDLIEEEPGVFRPRSVPPRPKRA
jgi:uncharacterized protein (DUF433 family)